MKWEAYSYRRDPTVPEFDDSQPLFVFDNVCVLCSGGVSFLMRRRAADSIRFTSAQGELGQSLYRHYGLDMDDTYLFVSDGCGYVMSDGYLALVQKMGGAWRLAILARLVPRFVRDAIYRLVARNRYRWFGKQEEACALLTQEQRARLL